MVWINLANSICPMLHFVRDMIIASGFKSTLTKKKKTWVITTVKSSIQKGNIVFKQGTGCT